MNTWNSKAWDGCLQARAIKVLHSAVCVSDYYYYYYYYYCCCCCRCCCCCYISTQTSSNYKACADWPRLRSMRQSDYLITGRARGTREGERGPTPLFSPRASSTFLLSLPKKAMSGYVGGSYSETFMRASKYWKNLVRTDQERRGDKRSFVLHWFF